MDKGEATEIVLWAEAEARFFRERHAMEPSPLVLQILAAVPALEAAGLVERYRYVARRAD